MKRATPLATHALGLIAGFLIAQTAFGDYSPWWWIAVGLLTLAGLANATAATFAKETP